MSTPSAKSNQNTHTNRMRFAAVFVVAVLLNYPWELAQSPLYSNAGRVGTVWWHCFVASLGDGVLVAIVYFVGTAIFRQPTWFEHAGAKQYVAMLITGGLIGVVVEWVAVHVAHRWAYAAEMPLLPGFDVGIVPVAQMLVLPLLVFRIVATWDDRLSRRPPTP